MQCKHRTVPRRGLAVPDQWAPRVEPHHAALIYAYQFVWVWGLYLWTVSVLLLPERPKYIPPLWWLSQGIRPHGRGFRLSDPTHTDRDRQRGREREREKGGWKKDLEKVTRPEKDRTIRNRFTVQRKILKISKTKVKVNRENETETKLEEKRKLVRYKMLGETNRERQ